jgi:hypothetical protein
MRKILISVVLVPIAALPLIAQGTPSASTTSTATPLPKHLAYRAFLAWAKALKDNAVSAGTQDPYAFAVPFATNAGLANGDIDKIRIEADLLDHDLKLQDGRAATAVAAYRASALKAVQAGQPLPPLPPVLHQLQLERDADNDAHGQSSILPWARYDCTIGGISRTRGCSSRQFYKAWAPWPENSAICWYGLRHGSPIIAMFAAWRSSSYARRDWEFRTPVIGFLLVWVVAGASCLSGPKLAAPKWTSTMTMEAFRAERVRMSSAPIVVVGTVGHDQTIGRRFRSPYESELWYILHRVNITVENVLKGDNLREGMTIPVYYFGFASTVDGGRHLGIWSRGERDLFFIEKDSGVFRIVCDGIATCIFQVCTGSHVGYRFAQNEPLAYRIADMLLTKGSGISDHQMAGTLAKMPIIPAGYPPRQYAIQRLKELGATSNQELHVEVCWTLQSVYQTTCQ